MPSEEKKPKSPWKLILVIVIVLVFILGAYLGLAAILRKVNEGESTSNPVGTQKAGKFDQSLVGTWISDCLVPDPNSPWSEKHQYVIKSDGTAVHTRRSSSGHDCSAETTLTNNYKLTVVKNGTSSSLGEVNILDTDQNITYYDVYQVNGNTLLFGQGFRNNLTYDSKQGTSEADRISTLNNYIIYKK